MSKGFTQVGAWVFIAAAVCASLLGLFVQMRNLVLWGCHYTSSDFNPFLRFLLFSYSDRRILESNELTKQKWQKHLADNEASVRKQIMKIAPIVRILNTRLNSVYFEFDVTGKLLEKMKPVSSMSDVELSTDFLKLVNETM